jgi:hypothetical protein
MDLGMRAAMASSRLSHSTDVALAVPTLILAVFAFSSNAITSCWPFSKCCSTAFQKASSAMRLLDASTTDRARSKPPAPENS